ncbi:tetratricopeptide repeat protein [Thalassobaculum litoreum]|uniref:Tetratricopeptide repeat-containing protein n=1 Tax=Thalassobaculum litoreum DSM 18839 TaxID=1123362 RepID=A0A8G2BK62_9PROT|nr:tetratricopeptide repeat protein [Thalassobaculum litoreum]SDG16431.1 Tetratricopeptide repeat-containing protein [Thalassobaculum litoreum DSM 18839]
MPMDPQTLTTLQARAQAALGRADWPAADAALTGLLGAAPGSASLLYNRGLVRKRLGNPTDALADLEAALAIEPQHANARFERASTLLDIGELEAAAEGFAAYLALVPDDDDALLNLGRLQLRLGRPHAASDTLARIEGDAPTVVLARAEALRDRGDVHGCRRLLAELDGHGAEIDAARLKVATQGAAGRISLDPAQLFAPPR